MEQFIEKSRKVHGDKYDYTYVKYVNSYTKVQIVCSEHGSFWQLPQHHIGGSGCPKCGRERGNKKKSMNIDMFIEKSQRVHGDKYDYSDAIYSGAFNKITIACPIHGKFEQLPSDHMKGHGCPKCGRIRSEICKHMTLPGFMAKAKEIHDNKYDYSRVEYKNTMTDIIIKCPIHGEFAQKPKNHIQGHGCPCCATTVSTGHKELIEFIESYIDSISVNDTSTIPPFELDVYLPSQQIAIEFNGDYWHSYDRIESCDERQKHKNKHLYCIKSGITLIQICEFEWRERQDIVKSMLLNSIGKSNRIYARKCDVVEIKSDQYRTFINDNHLYGHKTNPTIMIGLIFGGQLVSAISFSKHRKYQWEINRLASLKNYVVVGGVSKMISLFINNYHPDSILTYADARYGTGNVYNRLGFELIDHTKPNYRYIKRHQVFSRQQFQKHKLKDKLENFDPNLTEAENMFNNGYRRLWDAGHYKFVWSK